MTRLGLTLHVDFRGHSVVDYLCMFELDTPSDKCRYSVVCDFDSVDQTHQQKCRLQTAEAEGKTKKCKDTEG